MALKSNLRLYILMVLVGISLFYILSPLVLSRSGISVSKINPDQKCSSINEGDKITQIAGFTINSPEDFDKAVAEIKANSTVTMVVNDGPGNCIAVKDGDLGFQVTRTKTQILQFGSDIFGGTAQIYKVNGKNEEIENVIYILKKRAAALGDSDFAVTRNENQITTVGIRNGQEGILFERGQISGRIEITPKFLNGETKIKNGIKSYTVTYKNNSISIDSKIYGPGDIIELDGIRFYLLNLTNTSADMEVEFFSNNDIIEAPPASSGTRLVPNARLYQFSTSVALSQVSSEKFGNLTKGLPTVFSGTQTIIDANLVLYLDGKVESKLNIPFELAGKPLQSGIGLIGYKPSLQEADNTRLKLLAAAQMTPLDINIEKIGEKKTEAPLQMISFVLGGIGIILILLTPFIYITINKLKVLPAIYMISFLISQIIIVAGTVAISQVRFGLNWLVDFGTLAGMLLGIAFSLAQFILVCQKHFKGKIHNVRIGNLKVAPADVALNITAFVLGFVTLFTPFRGLGLTLILFLIIENLFTKNLLRASF